MPTKVPELAPKVIVGVGNEFGGAGICHVTIVLAAELLPTAITVGLLQVKVVVSALYVTFGDTVFVNITTGNGV